MEYYERDFEDDYSELYRVRVKYPGNDDEYTLGEFAKRLIKNPDGAYEHICECCMRFERIELYEIVKALALGILYDEEEYGKTAFHLAGSYLLDSIKTGLPFDPADSINSSDYFDDESALDDYIDDECMEDSFVKFKSLLDKAIKANNEEKKQYKKLNNYISQLEAEYGPSKSENDESESLESIVFNYLYLESVNKADIYKAFKKRFFKDFHSQNKR